MNPIAQTAHKNRNNAVTQQQATTHHNDAVATQANQPDYTCLPVRAMSLPHASLLRHELSGFTHEDCFAIEIPLSAFQNEDTKSITPESLLSHLLTGFLSNSPKGVAWLMRIRNVLVSPIQLRTSSLGCPVSSLLSEDKSHLFANTFPVLAEQVSQTRAQVLLGANDKHLQFRSCVAVQFNENNTVNLSLSTRVRPNNWFGHVYMAVIYRVHTQYIEPTMLRYAVGHALATAQQTKQKPYDRIDISHR